VSQENVETVRRGYEMLAEGELSRFDELAHPDAVIDMSRHPFLPATFSGREGMRRFVEQMDQMWQDFRVEPEEFIDAGDTVVVAVRASGRGRDGDEVSKQLFAVWTLRGGKVARVTGGYENRTEALEAASLSE
jgi:ketosteroid isomerase-like protein